MKLTFTLKGRQLFTYVLIILVLGALPMVVFAGLNDWSYPIPFVDESGIFMLFLGLYEVILLTVIMIQAVRLVVGHLRFGDDGFSFEGDTLSFLWLMIYGSVLSAVTIGIYVPWFVKKVNTYFIENTRLGARTFTFNGEPKQIIWKYIGFVILMAGVTGLVTRILGPDSVQEPMTGAERMFSNIVSSIVSVPLVYLFLKWTLQISYHELKLQQQFETRGSMWILLRNMVLTNITFGLFGPFAQFSWYAYFAERVSFQSDKESYHFRISGEKADVYKLILREFLLTIITLGIYGAWAFCHVVEAVLDHTEISREEGTAAEALPPV